MIPAELNNFDAHGKAIRAFNNMDIPEVKITRMTGMHVLPNGHIVTGATSRRRRSYPRRSVRHIRTPPPPSNPDPQTKLQLFI